MATSSLEPPWMTQPHTTLRVTLLAIRLLTKVPKELEFPQEVLAWGREGIAAWWQPGEEPVSQEEIAQFCSSDPFPDHLSGKTGAETTVGQHGRDHTSCRTA